MSALPPKADMRDPTSIRPLCANSDLTHRSRTAVFDQLVGALLENPRDVEIMRLCGLEVDDQLEAGGSLHWQVSWLFSLQDAISIARRASPIIEPVKPVAQQASEFSELTVRIDGGETVTSSQRCDLRAMDNQERIRHHDQAAIRYAGLRGNDRFELRNVVNGRGDHLHSQGRGGGFHRV